MDIGSVPGEIGILPEYREGYRNPPGAKWAMMGLSGKEKRQPYMGDFLVALSVGRVTST